MRRGGEYARCILLCSRRCARVGVQHHFLHTFGRIVQRERRAFCRARLTPLVCRHCLFGDERGRMAHQAAAFHRTSVRRAHLPDIRRGCRGRRTVDSAPKNKSPRPAGRFSFQALGARPSAISVLQTLRRRETTPAPRRAKPTRAIEVGSGIFMPSCSKTASKPKGPVTRISRVPPALMAFC